MRRVAWVRIERIDEGTRCEVAGIGHRVPLVRQVPFHTAAALVADGVPVVFSRRRHPEPEAV